MSARRRKRTVFVPPQRRQPSGFLAEVGAYERIILGAVGRPGEFEVRPTTHAGGLVRKAGSLNDAYHDLLKPATAHRKRNEERGLARRRGKPSLDVLGSAAGARLDPALKDRACGTQEGQTVCGLPKHWACPKQPPFAVSSLLPDPFAHTRQAYASAREPFSAKKPVVLQPRRQRADEGLPVSPLNPKIPQESEAVFDPRFVRGAISFVTAGTLVPYGTSAACHRRTQA